MMDAERGNGARSATGRGTPTMTSPGRRYGLWSLDHPVLAVITFAGPAVLCGALGILAAIVTTATHLVAPANAGAGLGMGVGGAVLGILCGYALVERIDRATRGTR